MAAAALEATRLHGQPPSMESEAEEALTTLGSALETRLKSGQPLSLVADSLPLESLWLSVSRDRQQLLGMRILDCDQQSLAGVGLLAEDLPGRLEVRCALADDRGCVGYLSVSCRPLPAAPSALSSGLPRLLLNRHIASLLLALSVLLLLLDRRSLTKNLAAGYVANVDKMATGLANCIRNSLNSMRFRLASAQRRSAAARPHIAAVSGEVSRLERLVDRFLSFSQPRSWIVGPHCLDKVVREAVLRVQSEFPAVGFETDLEAQLCVDICPEALSTAVYEILVNSAEALPQGGRVEVRLVRRKGRALLSVADDGPGVPEALRESLFQPFTSGDPDRPGLGLAIARSLIEVHGGNLSLHDGSTFIVDFPVREG